MVHQSRRIAMAAALMALATASHAADPRPCSLLTAAEVTSILGSAAGPGEAEGPEVDEELHSTSWTCSWLVQKPETRYLGISAIRSRSAAEAAQSMKKMLDASHGIPAGMQLQSAAGVGEQSAWGAAEEGAVWVTRRGEMILVIVVGAGQKSPEAQREPLRKLLTAALGRL